MCTGYCLCHRSLQRSVPRGQVDKALARRTGLFPMESSTETMVKRAIVGPRTDVIMIMKKLFQMEFAVEKAFVNN